MGSCGTKSDKKPRFLVFGRVSGRVCAIRGAVEGLRAPPLDCSTDRGAPFLVHFGTKNGQKTMHKNSTKKIWLSAVSRTTFRSLLGALLGQKTVRKRLRRQFFGEWPGCEQTLVITVYLKDAATQERVQKTALSRILGTENAMKNGTAKKTAKIGF